MTKIATYMKHAIYKPNSVMTIYLLRRAPWKVVFFGSDDFSLESLKVLHSSLSQGNLIDKLAVVTSKKSRLQQFAIERKLPLSIWPEVDFSADFDVGLVSSFGHLIPENIISKFPLGILNVHASLLPRWRGAAPIVYAILNNDTLTGVTIMRIKPYRFDEGEIVMQKSCPIMPHDTAPELTKRLSKLGAQTLMDCILELPYCLEKAVPQPSTGITYAPKVSREMRKVQWWLMDSTRVYNLHRALFGLYTLTTDWCGVSVKLMDPLPPSASEDNSTNIINAERHLSTLHIPGSVRFDRERNLLYVLCADKCWIAFKRIGVPGKKPMTAADFYNGYLSKKCVEERIFS